MGKTWTAGKPQESQEKTITMQLNDIFDEFCDSYCKYPDICMEEKKDPDEAEELLYEKHCNRCPITRV